MGHGRGNFALPPRRQFEHQVGGRGKGIQPAVRPDGAAFGRGQLLVAVITVPMAGKSPVSGEAARTISVPSSALV